MNINYINIIIAISLLIFYLISNKKLYKLDIKKYGESIANNLKHNRIPFYVSACIMLAFVNKFFIFLIGYIILFIIKIIIDGKILLDYVKNKQ